MSSRRTLTLAAVGLLSLCAQDSRAQDLTPIRALGSSLNLGAPRSHDALTVYPLIARGEADPTPYVTVDEATRRKLLRISELDGGQVPTLRVRKRGPEQVFIMAGEIVTGAKQDRMSAHDVLITDKPTLLSLPVYCVEQNRWTQQTQHFAGGNTAGTKKLRRSAVKKFAQGKIWQDVAEKSAEASVNSATGTMQAVYDSPQVQRRIAAYVAALGDLPAQSADAVGFVVVGRDRVESADVFANPRLLRDLWPKLLRAAAVDAVTRPAAGQDSPDAAAVQRFVDRGFAAAAQPVRTPGAGQEVLLEGEAGVSGSALLRQGRVVHLALFSEEKGDRPRELGSGLRQQQQLEVAPPSNVAPPFPQDLTPPAQPPSPAQQNTHAPSTQQQGVEMNTGSGPVEPAPQRKTTRKAGASS